MSNEAQHRGDVVVSVVRDGKAAISTDVGNYVNLSADEWRWLVAEAGPKVLAAAEREGRS